MSARDPLGLELDTPPNLWLTSTAVFWIDPVTGQVFDLQPDEEYPALPSDAVRLIPQDEDMVTADWNGLLAILDRHYPPEVFTGESGDAGPRLIALTRELSRLQVERRALWELLKQMARHLRSAKAALDDDSLLRMAEEDAAKARAALAQARRDLEDAYKTIRAFVDPQDGTGDTATLAQTFPFGQFLDEEPKARRIPRRMLRRPLGLSEAEIDDLIEGRRELTRDLAARLGNHLGTSAELWLNLDRIHQASRPSQEPSQAAYAAPGTGDTAQPGDDVIERVIEVIEDTDRYLPRVMKPADVARALAAAGLLTAHPATEAEGQDTEDER